MSHIRESSVWISVLLLLLLTACGTEKEADIPQDTPVPETEQAAPEEGLLPFDVPMELWFGSGAGGWRTIITLHPDGSFAGDYSDADMGDSGESYPNGTQYICRFHGRFGNMTQETGASWSMTLDELVIDTGRPIGEEWIENGVRYIASSPYGMDGKDGEPLESGAEFMLYTPDAAGYAPGAELYGMADESSELYEFWTWWPDRHAFSADQSTLGCYALRSVEAGYGFFDLQSWGIE